MDFVQLNKYKGSTTKLNIKNGVPYISFNALDNISWLKNGFSTKLGGVSTKHLYSLNLGFNRGDLQENVIKNHEIISEAIGFDACNIVSSHQTHTTNVKVIGKSDCGKGVYFPRDYEDVDGLITNEKDVVLATYYADCVPLYIVDIEHKAIGLSHSGWRGTVGKIGQVTIKKMSEIYGTNPENVVACIGPSICQNCYEVSQDVADEFDKIFSDSIDEILLDKGNGNGNGKFQLNLWKANKQVFLEAGVLPENIYTTDICTCCNTNTLYSHRGHNGMRGNLGAFLCLV